MSAMIDATSFPGGDASVQIRNALNSILSGGFLVYPVIIDARGFVGEQVLSVNIYENHDRTDDTTCVILWGPATFTCQFNTPLELPANVGIPLRSNHHHLLFGTQFVMHANENLFGMVQIPDTQPGAHPLNIWIQRTSPQEVNMLGDHRWIRVGQLIGILGHVPQGGTDQCVLTGSLSAVATSIPVRFRGASWPVTGLNPFGTSGYLRLSTGTGDPEIVKYTRFAWNRREPGVGRFTGCTRGYGNTRVPAQWPDALLIYRAVYEVFTVASEPTFDGTQTTFTIDAPSAFCNQGYLTPQQLCDGQEVCRVGAYNGVSDGWGILDGNHCDGSANTHAVSATLSRWFRLGQGITIKNWPFTGVGLVACRDALIDGNFRNNGTTGSAPRGFNVVLFGNTKRCTVYGAYEGGNMAVAVDDRSVYPQDFDNPSDGNIIRPRQIVGSSVGMKIEGGNYNLAVADVALQVAGDIIQAGGEQWTHPHLYAGNVFDTRVVQGGSGKPINLYPPIIGPANSALVRTPPVVAPALLTALDADFTPDLSQGSYFKLQCSAGRLTINPPSKGWPGVGLVLDLSSVPDSQLNVIFPTDAYRLADGASAILLYAGTPPLYYRMVVTFHFDGSRWIESARSAQSASP